VPMHFVHRPGNGPAPVPLLLLHGWPWTFWDWHASVDALADPVAHGGDAADAFDVVVASLPGTTFSTPVPNEPMGYTQMADVFVELMCDALGHERFAVAGGDMGTLVAEQLGHKYADRLIGVHLFGVVPLNVFGSANPLAVGPDFGMLRPATPPSDPVYQVPDEPRRSRGSSHLVVHALEPQTLAAGLSDSPAGLLAWLLYRRAGWSDNGGDVLDAFDADFLLSTFSLYWYTDSIASSIRRYHDMVFHPWQPSHPRTPVVEAPTGLSFFDRDQLTSRSRFWCPEYFNVVRASSHTRGGHFAPAEEPDIAVNELRETFRLLR
jgi:pimeloyl-ACP methyl ester carboxylesterase